MAFDTALVDRVREIISRSHSDVEERKMFGGLCFMVNGKMCVGVERKRIMVRFDPTGSTEIMEEPGAAPMDFTGRKMKGYAFVDASALTTNSELEFWIAVALEFNEKAKSSRKDNKRHIPLKC